MISRDNYEIWIIDYLDGKLTTEQVAELVLFLENHPDIAEEFDGLDEVNLEVEAHSFELKDSLFKEPMDLPMDEVDKLLVKKLEGDLSQEELKAVDSMIDSHEWIARSWLLLQRTHLTPSEELFVGKENIAIPASVNLSDEEMALVAIAEGDLDKSEIPQGASNAEERLAAYAQLKLNPDESLVFANKTDLFQKAKVVALRPWLVRAAAAAAIVLLLWQAWSLNSASDGISVEGARGVVEVKDAESQKPVDTDKVIFDSSEETLESNSSFVADSAPPTQLNTPEYDKVIAPSTLRAINSEAIAYGLPNQVLAISELPQMDDIQLAELHDEPLVEPVEEVPTAFEFIGTKIKERLWGGKDIPEEDFGIALAGKAAEKYSARTGADVAIATREDSKGDFALRIGRLEISRY